MHVPIQYIQFRYQLPSVITKLEGMQSIYISAVLTANAILKNFGKLHIRWYAIAYV